MKTRILRAILCVITLVQVSWAENIRGIDIDFAEGPGKACLNFTNGTSG